MYVQHVLILFFYFAKWKQSNNIRKQVLQLVARVQRANFTNSFIRVCEFCKAVVFFIKCHMTTLGRFFLLFFYVRPSDILLSILRSDMCHGCINHDIVVGPCSKLLMRLSYYIHRIYVLEYIFSDSRVSNPCPLGP